MGRIKFLVKYHLARIILYLFILPKRAYGAELGVRKGGNAKLLYYLTKPDELVLIDSYDETDLYSDEEIRKMYNKVLDWTKNKYVIMLMTTSKQASTYIFGGEGLDWIYIDANHEDLYNDLTYWYPNVREGGIICGDDYSEAFPKIREDLDKFCDEKGLTYKTLHYQWWIKK